MAEWRCYVRGNYIIVITVCLSKLVIMLTHVEIIIMFSKGRVSDFTSY